MVPSHAARLAIYVNHDDGIYRDGNPIVLTVVSSTSRAGYLYIDFVDRQGDVTRLMPSPEMPENQVDAGENRVLSGYVAGEPYGRDLTLAFWCPEQLFVEDPTGVETVADYGNRLADMLQSHGAGCSMSYRFTETVGR